MYASTWYSMGMVMNVATVTTTQTMIKLKIRRNENNQI